MVTHLGIPLGRYNFLFDISVLDKTCHRLQDLVSRILSFYSEHHGHKWRCIQTMASNLPTGHQLYKNHGTVCKNTDSGREITNSTYSDVKTLPLVL